MMEAKFVFRGLKIHFLHFKTKIIKKQSVKVFKKYFLRVGNDN